MKKTIHELKTYPEYFQETLNANKLFECRLNDRNFQVGDTVILKEWSGSSYTGREITSTIKYILDNFEGLTDGYVMLSLDIGTFLPDKITDTTYTDDNTSELDYAAGWNACVDAIMGGKKE